MDISAFLTQQIAITGKGAAGTGAPLSGGTGVFGMAPGMSFMDLIFARLTTDAAGEVTADTAQTGKPQELPSSLLKKLTEKIEMITSQPDYEGHAEPLTAEQILQAVMEYDPAALEEIATPEEFAALQLDLAQEIAPEGQIVTGQTPPLPQADAKKKWMEVLESLLAGLPQESQPEILDIAPGKAVVTLRTDKEDGAPALIATGLSVEELTKLLQDIANGNEEAQAYVIGLVKILPPEAKKEAIFLPRGIVVVQPQHPAGESSTPQTKTPADEVASQLNALTEGGEEGGEYTPLEESDFEGVLRILERARTQGSQTGQDNNAGIDKAINNIRQQSAGNSAVPGNPPALTEIFADFSMSSIYPEGFDFGAGTHHHLSLNGPAQLASLISHAPQAVYPHPATQMVASVIAKATTNGESKNITIHLDPPDLGKVHVRMELGKDNSVKAHMVIEKPETYLMLQRDAHVLERALQEAGMDTGGGLSFELAQDGGFFDRDGQGTGGNSGGGDSDSAETGGDSEIIETRMDWYVDPETGLTRYDALV